MYLTPLTLLITAVIWHLVIFRMSPKLGLIKLNFNKKPIISSYGIVAFIYMAAIICSFGILGYTKWNSIELYLSVMGAMWILGVIDDIFGTREVGGFKGHFRKLIFERKLTTGAVKAIGGGTVALIAGWSISGDNIFLCLLSSMVIALTANILNLFDLRPGRAVTVFFFGLGVTYIVALDSLVAPCIIVAIAAVTFAFAIIDSRGKAMMGDSGSNTIGAALGLTIALNTKPMFQMIAILIMIAVHLYSEKHSVSALIEGNTVLRNIDRRLGVR